MARSIYDVTDELRNEIDHLNRSGYEWVGDVYPVTYGYVAPEGFGRRPDEKQRKFNFMVHVAQGSCRQDATIAQYKAGLVVGIPNDTVWCHWLVNGVFPNDFMADSTDEMILKTLALFHKVVDAYGVDRQEFYARMMLRNEQAFEEWLEDYARREGMFVESARIQVMEERATAARSANRVGGSTPACDMQKEPRHPFSWYEKRYEPYGDGIDVVDHDWRKSYEHIREKIDAEKRRRDSERKEVPGLTIADMHAAGVSYSDIKKTEAYRIDGKTKEIIVVRRSDEKFLRGTGKYVARLIDNAPQERHEVASEQPTEHGAKVMAEEPENDVVMPREPAPAQVPANNEAKRTPAQKKSAKKCVARPPKPEKEPFDPLAGIVNPRPQDKSGWKGTRKRRSCVTTMDAYDSADGCLAIGAMFARK